MAHIPPTPDSTSNQFKRSIVSGRFVVQDRYESYGATGAPSGNVIDTGDSFFYGDVRVSGDLLVFGSGSIPNYYSKTAVDGLITKVKNGTTKLDTYYTMSESDARYFTQSQSDNRYYSKTYINSNYNNITTSEAKYYQKTYIDGLALGVTGFTGAKGEMGFTGARGETGFTGAKGDTGFTGSAGSQGAKGDTGFTGSAGSQGAMGDTGFTGAAGSPGAKGDTGERGDMGFTGARGVEGSRGFTGAQGIQGIAGTSYFTQSGTNLYYTGGNVGIGKIPTSTLDVDGTLTTIILNIGNFLKIGGTASNLYSSTNLSFPLDPYYYLYPSNATAYIEIRLPDVHQKTIPPFQFTIVNTNKFESIGIIPYSSDAITPTFLYSPMRAQLASRNQSYDVLSTTSTFITIMYFSQSWYIMYPY